MRPGADGRWSARWSARCLGSDPRPRGPDRPPARPSLAFPGGHGLSEPTSSPRGVNELVSIAPDGFGVALGRSCDDILRASRDQSIPPGAVNSVELEPAHRGGDALDAYGRQRGQVGIAVHEPDAA